MTVRVPPPHATPPWPRDSSTFSRRYLPLWDLRAWWSLAYTRVPAQGSGLGVKVTAYCLWEAGPQDVLQPATQNLALTLNSQ